MELKRCKNCDELVIQSHKTFLCDSCRYMHMLNTLEKEMEDLKMQYGLLKRKEERNKKYISMLKNDASKTESISVSE